MPICRFVGFIGRERLFLVVGFIFSHCLFVKSNAQKIIRMLIGFIISFIFFIRLLRFPRFFSLRNEFSQPNHKDAIDSSEEIHQMNHPGRSVIKISQNNPANLRIDLNKKKF